MSFFDELKNCLESGDVKTSSHILGEIYKKYGESWLDRIKQSDVFPNPLSQKFSNESLVTFLEALQNLYKKSDYKQLKKALDLFHSILQLYNKILKINEVISKTDFYEYPPEKQIQMFCVYLEDQARLLWKKYSEQRKIDDVSSAVDLINFNVKDGILKKGARAVVNFEGVGDAVDLNLRYIFSQYKDSLDGKYYTDVFPYRLKSFAILLHLANLRQTISNIWQNIKYRNWTFFLKNGYTYYHPPDKINFLKEEASRDRYRIYISELASGFFYYRPNNEKLFDKIISELNVKFEKKSGK